MFVLKPETAERLMQIVRDRTGDLSTDGNLARFNNQQWILVTGDGESVTVEDVTVTFFPANIVRFDVATLTWQNFAEVQAFSPNGIALRNGTKYLGYGFGIMEDAQVYAVTSECCANLKWYCMERMDWYCLTSPDEEPITECLLLTEGDLAALEGLGYTVESGPHDTEEECLAECEES